MMRYFYFFIVCAIMALVYIELLFIDDLVIDAASSTASPTRIHACVRTKDNLKYIEEFIGFHFAVGITSMSIYDDSSVAMNIKHPNITYKYVGSDELLENENHYLLDCFHETILTRDVDFIVVIDDDEFLTPIIGTNIGAIVRKFSRYRCIQMPVYFYGTKRSAHTGLVTQDYVHRERDYEQDPWKHYNSDNSNHVKKRIRKAIFKFPRTLEEKKDMMRLFAMFMRNGIIIHGYKANCALQEAIRVSHYARDMEDMDNRVSTFWQGIHGIRTRFDTDKKIRDYKRERDRNEQIDTIVAEISGVFFGHNDGRVHRKGNL